MTWTKELQHAVVWLGDTSTAALHIDLDKVGPLYRVEFRDYKHKSVYSDVETHWFVKYAKAKAEYDRQCLLAQEYAYGE